MTHALLKRRREASGFTILEVVLAMGILFVGVTAVAPLKHAASLGMDTVITRGGRRRQPPSRPLSVVSFAFASAARERMIPGCWLTSFQR